MGAGDGMSTPTLLLALEALAAESGLVGLGPSRIAVGVRGQREQWWLAECGPNARTELLEERPARCDFQVLLGSREAEALATGQFPEDPQLLLARGDVRLFRRLVDRLRPKTWLELRVDQSK